MSEIIIMFKKLNSIIQHFSWCSNRESKLLFTACCKTFASQVAIRYILCISENLEQIRTRFHCRILYCMFNVFHFRKLVTCCTRIPLWYILFLLLYFSFFMLYRTYSFLIHSNKIAALYSNFYTFHRLHIMYQTTINIL